jgi:hypothetical protein
MTGPKFSTYAGDGDGPKAHFDFHRFSGFDPMTGHITLAPVVTADDLLGYLGVTDRPFREQRREVLAFRASPGGQGMPDDMAAELLRRALIDG